MYADMICDIMPPIPEDDGNLNNNECLISENVDETEANIEQLMVSMLEERDKLQEKLHDSEDKLNKSQEKLIEIEKERDLLFNQLTENMPQDYVTLVRELAQLREQLTEKEDEVTELKAERNNTRLLLEHLEQLVARHERSIRTTVMRRQSQGVSSEVEVLKALKSLFEHHKALDEKVRERLKSEIEKNSQLKDELERTKNELTSLRETEQSKLIDIDQLKLISNGIIDPESLSGKLIEMQELMDKQCNELIAARSRIHELINRNKELEEHSNIFQRDLSYTHEQLLKYQRELKECQIQKEEQEERISILEKRYLNIQKEKANLNDFNNRLENELSEKETQIQNSDELYQKLQEKYDLLEQKLQSQNQRDLNQSTIYTNDDDKFQQLQCEYDDIKMELTRARQREKVTDEHNNRLSSTIDKLLMESNERLQVHLKERMQILEEKNNLMLECDKIKKQLDDVLNERTKLLTDMDKLKNEMENNRKELENIKRQTNEFNLNSSNNKQNTTIEPISNAKDRRQILPLTHEHDWDSTDQEQVINDVRLAFESSDVELTTDDDDSLYQQNCPVDNKTSSKHQNTDVQTLAIILQEQLDAINNEIRLIQAEKVDAELRAEQLETCANSNSINNSTNDNINSSFPLTLSPDLNRHYTPHYSITRKSNNNSSTTNNSHIYAFEENEYDHAKYRPTLHSFRSDYNTPERYLKCHSSPPLTPMHLRAPIPNHIYHLSSTIQNQYRLYTTPMRANLKPNINNIKYNSTNYQPVASTPASHQDSPSPISSQNSTSGDENSSHTRTNSIKKRSIRNSLGRFFTRKQETTEQKPIRENLSSPSDITREENEMTELTDGKLINLGKNEFDRRIKQKHELLDEVIENNRPFSTWDGVTVVAWLELWVKMPAWYVAACRANVKSGAIMSELNDEEIQRQIGISNPLHRLKLRLAIKEIISLTSSNVPRTSITSLVVGELDHEWIGNEWLTNIGLIQYRPYFMENLIDGRMLEHLHKRDLSKHLKMVDAFHRTSFHYGVMVLKHVNYDKKELNRRRDQTYDDRQDVIIWTNERIIQWLTTINGLKDYANNLLDTGIHGGILALDDTFDHNALAFALQIPNQQIILRQILEREFRHLINNGTNRKMDENDPKKIKRHSHLFSRKLKSKTNNGDILNSNEFHTINTNENDEL